LITPTIAVTIAPATPPPTAWPSNWPTSTPRALKDRQQRGEKCATARAAKGAGNGVADRAEVYVLDRRAGGIAADRPGN
jgi:hypothetical protein